MGKNKVVVVMPAYNAESTLEKTVNDIPERVVDEIIMLPIFLIKNIFT